MALYIWYQQCTGWFLKPYNTFHIGLISFIFMDISFRCSRQIWYLCLGEARRLNPLRPRQNGRHFTDDTLNCIFLNENVRISITISLKFAPKGSINNIPALVQIMVWRRPGDKPLSEPMIVTLLTHICVTRPQWVNENLLGCHIGNVKLNFLQWLTVNIFQDK